MSLSNGKIDTISISEHPVLSVFISRLKLLADLTKVKITVLVSLSAALGYILAAPALSFSIVYLTAGIFLIASSSAALNQYQEFDIDALMKRTASRPLPSGKLEPLTVLFISAFLLLTGSFIILKTNFTAFITALCALLIYNVIYTPLKRKTSLSIIAGAFVGAIPPLAGWAAAGGNLPDNRILIISFYFFIWQIPHFCLLLLLFGSEYKEAGFATLKSILNNLQLKRITFVWTAATVVTAMLIPLFGTINFYPTMTILFAASAIVLYYTFRFVISEDSRRNTVTMFIKINFYTLLIIILLSADKLLSII